MKLKLLDNYRKDEQGGILAFYVVMFMLMMVGGGMSIDFMRHEMKRESLQSALDRGVLAATSNAQTTGATSAAEIAAAELEAIATVRSYITISGFDPDAAGVTITPNITALSQRVDASSNFAVDTYFLRLSGIDILNGAAASAAAISASKIEISLVLDVSGSMDFDVIDPDTGNILGRRIDFLQTAAKDFAATLLNGTRSNYTSMSIVPFSGQVALPGSMAIEYTNFGLYDAGAGTYNPWHDYSNCMEFNAVDYLTTSFDKNQSRDQYEHFNLWGGRGGGRPSEQVSYCPGSNSEILPLANNLNIIDNMIDDLTPQGSTNTWTGIKWGVTLLDPDSDSLVANLSDVDPLFAGRPAAYSDVDTLKFLIVMADGQNTAELIIPESTYNAWGTSEAYTQQNADYWAPYNAGGVLWDASSNYLPGVVRTSGAEGDARMQAICGAAKEAGITIFAIGTDIAVGSNEYVQMRNCATTVGHFYSVGAQDLDAAFNSISNTIQKLRLVN